MLQADPAREEIEGIEEAEGSAWGDYPIDTLLIRTEPRTVHEVLRRIRERRFVMDPDFQRDFIWPTDKQSKLIESVLMRIPLPVLYLAEDEQGRMIVVDGLQRLTTFLHFLDNKLKLDLPQRPELHGKAFQDLSPKLQNRIEDCNLILYIIDAKVPERARLDIFERVNLGVPLTRQQMRNCLYVGAGTMFLKQEAATDLFKRATGKSLDSARMRDREFVNRFCAFQLLPLEEYKGDLDDHLARVLKHLNRVTTSQMEQLSKQFRISLENNLAVFGKHAFRKHKYGQDSRNIINAALWDVMSTGLSRYSNEATRALSTELKTGFFQLLEDREFVSAITDGPNQTNRVRHRFAAFDTMLLEVFGARQT